MVLGQGEVRLRLVLDDLPGVEYNQYSIPGRGPVHSQLLYQTTVAGEFELLLVLTCDNGSEEALETYLENLDRLMPLRPGPSADALVRIRKGWSLWPTDSRVEIPLRALVFQAIIPANIRDVTMALPHFIEPHVVDIEGRRFESVEEVQGGFSFAYGSVRGASVGRVTFHSTRSHSTNPFRINVGSHEAGLQYFDSEDRFDARFVTHSDIETLKRFSLDIIDY